MKTLGCGLMLAMWSSVLAGEKNGAQLGPIEPVLAHKALGLAYFPDERIAIIRSTPNSRVLVAAGVESFMLEGPRTGHWTASARIFGPGKAGEFDNGYAGVSGAWRRPDGDFLAIYHAEDHEGMKKLGNGVDGFYCSVALALSHDDGRTFQKLGPMLTGQWPKDPVGRPDQGVGEPWLLAEPTGQRLYCYYTSHERVAGRGVQICLARCPVAEATKPATWKKFFHGAFSEPGLAGRDSPVLTCALEKADALFPHVLYVPAWRKFVMTFCVNAWDDQTKRNGICMAVSVDGIHWDAATRQQLWQVPVLPVTGRELAWHPTLTLDESADNGLTGWLWFGYSPRWGHLAPNVPHSLYRRRVIFEPH